jgi:hypothetical protein
VIDDTVTLLWDAEEATFWLTLFHSCPIPNQMTDEISFQFPVRMGEIVVSKGITGTVPVTGG